MSYNIIEETEASRHVRVLFSEIFGDGIRYVQMKIQKEGDVDQFVDFDNPAQVEDCMWKMQQYLKQRNTFGFTKEELRAAEEGVPTLYGPTPEQKAAMRLADQEAAQRLADQEFERRLKAEQENIRRAQDGEPLRPGPA